jgi:hypothetical protein
MALMSGDKRFDLSARGFTMLLDHGSERSSMTVGVFAPILVAAVLLAPPAQAHSDPADSSGTGVNIQISAYRADGVTPVLTSDVGFGEGVVGECETILFQAALSWAGGSNAAFEGGDWTLTTPDEEVHRMDGAGDSRLVHELGEVPCIGGVSDDLRLPGGRGLCNSKLTSLAASQISYTVSLADADFGTLSARTSLANAVAHIGPDDIFGVGAVTSLVLRVADPDDGSLGGTDSCDPRKPSLPLSWGGLR